MADNKNLNQQIMLQNSVNFFCVLKWMDSSLKIFSFSMCGKHWFSFRSIFAFNWFLFSLRKPLFPVHILKAVMVAVPCVGPAEAPTLYHSYDLGLVGTLVLVNLWFNDVMIHSHGVKFSQRPYCVIHILLSMYSLKVATSSWYHLITANAI